MENAPRVKEHTSQKLMTEPVDDEIAALLAAIEKEPVPKRLQDLALKLQSALARKRAEAGNS
jgi:hypothetical protein